MSIARLGSNRGIDWILLTVYAALVVIGWFMLYAVSYDPSDPYSYLDLNSSIGRQSIWLIVALIAFFLSFVVEWKFWNTFAFLIYVISLVLLLLVVVIGTEIKGAKSWIMIGSFSIQPSELAKFGTALAVASYLSLSSISIRSQRNLLTCFALFFIPSALIMLQPDAGSALVFMSFFLVLYRVGLSSTYYIIAGTLLSVIILSFMYGAMIVLLVSLATAGTFLAFQLERKQFWMIVSLLMSILIFVALKFSYELYLIPLFLVHIGILGFLNWKERNLKILTITLISLFLASAFSATASWAFNNVLKPHHQERINVWLRPDKCDPRGSLYNLIQSKTAIGSGGFSGKGFLEGSMTQLKYVPEQATDFIFATIGEEQGFIGVLGVIALYLILLIRITVVGERARNDFIKYYAYALAGILFFHFFINIGMTIGVTPVIGIPLPFLSKGGSSLVVFSVMLAVLIKMDLARNR